MITNLEILSRLVTANSFRKNSLIVNYSVTWFWFVTASGVKSRRSPNPKMDDHWARFWQSLDLSFLVMGQIRPVIMNFGTVHFSLFYNSYHSVSILVGSPESSPWPNQPITFRECSSGWPFGRGVNGILSPHAQKSASVALSERWSPIGAPKN